MDEQFLKRIFTNHQHCDECPRTEDVLSFYEQFLGLLFPNFSSQPFTSIEQLKEGFSQLKIQLRKLLREVMEKERDPIIDQFFDRIPELYKLLVLDINATYEGDPAAKSTQEVIRSYPGFYAIAAYRVAHELYKMRVPSIPRAITEIAHSKTGIDIHPGAIIGKSFCIDHGTGVVIGETTLIGNSVKIYQGVTLGALSVDKRDANSKRHPTIEDHVVIYAGATILGGETVIGEHSVIGGNVWLTKSVPAGSKVYYKATMHKEGEKPELIIIK